MPLSSCYPAPIRAQSRAKTVPCHLDAELRTVSDTAVLKTRLLRPNQQLLFEVMDERPKVVRDSIRVLSQHLRARARDLGELRRLGDHLSSLAARLCRGIMSSNQGVTADGCCDWQCRLPKDPCSSALEHLLVGRMDGLAGSGA